MFVPKAQVISENAKEFCDLIRPTFIYYQIPIGLGVMSASAYGIEKIKDKQNGCNELLTHDANGIQAQVTTFQGRLQQLANTLTLKEVAQASFRYGICNFKCNTGKYVA